MHVIQNRLVDAAAPQWQLFQRETSVQRFRVGREEGGRTVLIWAVGLGFGFPTPHSSFVWLAS